jgi:hypothetical protein
MATATSAAGRNPVRTRRPGLAHLSVITLLVVQALVGVTAVAGGAALILGTVNPELSTVMTPPAAYLEGSPFSSYLVPGLLLAVVVGGTQAIAFLLGLTRSPLGLPAAAAAAIGLLIWVFVQMVFIPFSFLQAVYFAFGIAEVGLVLLALGILPERNTSQ